MALLEQLTRLLPPSLRPYAKAIYPAIITIIGVIVTWIDTGDWDELTVRTAIYGAVLALVAYLIPNEHPDGTNVQAELDVTRGQE